MAHFNFVISQNAKWGHVGFYIDRHRIDRMTSSKYAYRKVLFYKKSSEYSTFDTVDATHWKLKNLDNPNPARQPNHRVNPIDGQLWAYRYHRKPA